MLLGVDTGGTFTDFVVFDHQGIRLHKVLSTPDDPSRAIVQGIAELGLDASELDLIHGSTVATNAVLERKGVRTLFITQKNMEDLLLIGRQTRPALYDLRPGERESIVKPRDCLGVSGRMDASGREIEPLQAEELQTCLHKASGYEAVAICLLFSFLNPAHEQKLKQHLPEHLFVSASHEVLAEYREYERGMTTLLNAYVGPLVQRYLLQLQSKLSPRHLQVMHSAGGVMDANEAGKQAVRMILSGPAGGLVACQFVGRQTGNSRLISFDMGGTSTDVALLLDGCEQTTEGEIAGMPVAVPMLDIHTIGAGGGSIAWLDEAGLPQVGPQSAGADPGPACYGRGGCQPTVTDANLVLGKIPAQLRLAGSMALDIEAARRALATFAKPLRLTIQEAAQAIVRLAEEHMAGALRVVSVQRGHDPADFSLISFGGAGGLHACALAEALGMSRVILPLSAGAFSALGMLAGRRQMDVSLSRRLNLEAENTPARLEELFLTLSQRAKDEMKELSLTFERSVDIRYAGQGFHLTLPMQQDPSRLAEVFEQAHEKTYGHRLNRPIEIITARLTAFAPTPELELPTLPAASHPPRILGYSEVFGVGSAPLLQRASLRPGHECLGPALVIEDTATQWLPPGWGFTVSEHGHLLLERTP